jgi:hypothetical protein
VFGGVLGRRARPANRSGATERDCGRRVGLLDVHAAVREILMIRVGCDTRCTRCTRCVISSTDHTMKRPARITLNVAWIRAFL